ncbi:MAG: hypothetical protein ACOVQX_04015 [Legionella sp.]
MRITLSKPFILLFLILAGCRSIGPGVLNNDRYNYNLAMNYSSKQELLLNMVRLRYDDSPMALKIGNISGSTRITNNASLSGTTNFPAPGRTNGALQNATGFEYSDNPIISYTPLDSKGFTVQFLTSMDLHDIGLLLQSSWSIPRVFRITLQQAGSAMNAPSAARATSSHQPQYQAFIDMVYVLRRLQLADAFIVFYTHNNGNEELTLSIDKRFKFTQREKHILAKAGIEVYNHAITFTNTPKPHQVYVVTRSMLGILNYLSKGLDVPTDDIKKKVVTLTEDKNGGIFDWQKVLRGMMKIYWSKTNPGDQALVTVPYRGRWYYIKDTDNDSKQTLMLLSNISGLIEATPPGSELPPTLSRTI